MSLESRGALEALNTIVAKTIGRTGFLAMTKLMDLTGDGDPDPPEQEETVMMSEYQGGHDAAFKAELNTMRESGHRALAEVLAGYVRTDAKPQSLTVDYSFPGETPYNGTHVSSYTNRFVVA